MHMIPRYWFLVFGYGEAGKGDIYGVLRTRWHMNGAQRSYETASMES